MWVPEWVPEVSPDWVPIPEWVPIPDWPVPGAMWVSCRLEVMPVVVVPEDMPVGSAPVFSPTESMQHFQQRGMLCELSIKATHPSCHGHCALLRGVKQGIAASPSE